MTAVTLVEVDTGLRIGNWVAEAYTFDLTTIRFDDTTRYFSDSDGVAARALDADVLHVDSVEEDGVALTERSSWEVRKLTGSWYWDATTRRIWIHATDQAVPSGHVYLVIVPECLSRERGLTKTRDGVPAYYDPRIRSLPTISHALRVEEPGAGAVLSAGELTVDNRDGRYDTLIGRRLLEGREVRIYRGDDAAALSTFERWLVALASEPTAGSDVLSVPLVSLSRRLDRPAITTAFGTTTYPDLDANVTGYNIPKVWGTVISAEAFRIASGTWKVASHAMTSISAARKADGTAVTIDSTDLPNGEFSVNASYDTEARLYVDCRGYALDQPGEILRDIAEKSSIATADIDTAAMTQLDTDRNVSLGLQVRTGSIREALDEVAESAFVDWMVTRTNKLSAKVRRRDEGNLVSNDDFETDTTGWTVANGATITRTTTYKFRGAASASIVKPAGQPLAYAAYALSDVATGRYVVATCMAAVTTGSTSTFQLALVLADDTELLSDEITLSSTQWTRVTLSTLPVVSGTVVTFDSTTVTFDSTTVMFSSGVSELRVYPRRVGATGATVVIDDVEVVSATIIDDTLLDPDGLGGASARGPVLWRVRAGYQYDGRTATYRVSEDSDTTIQRLVPTAESREFGRHVTGSADAATVAGAALDYFGSPRLQATFSLLNPDDQISVGSVLLAMTSRVPSLPGNNRLFRVVGVEESHGERDVLRVRVTAEGIYDPINDQESIVAT